MITAGMVTHTPVTEYLKLTLREFFRIFSAMCDVLEKRRGYSE